MRSKFILIVLLLPLCTIFSQNVYDVVNGENSLHIKTFGVGDPILIINGGPGMSSEGFASLALELGKNKNNQSIIYDQRGTGQSKMKTINSENMTMDLLVEDIETIRKYLKIKEWVVFGHSFGGMLASYYTSKYPDRVKGLILSSSGGVDLTLLSSLDITSKLTQKERDSLSHWSKKIADGDTSYHAQFQRGMYLAPAYLYDKSYVKIIAKRLTQGNMTVNNLIWQNLRAINFDCKNELKTFKKPVLIIQGKEDIIPIKISKKTNEIFPNSKLKIVEKCAHYGWLEQPSTYFKNIRTFLKTLDSKKM